MKEEILHHLWKHIPNCSAQLKTTKGLKLKVNNAGLHNFNSGPDFLNAQLELEGIQWHGNVEIHVRSSDWIRHGHQSDPAYSKVLLHVVFEDDAELDLNCLTLEISTHKELLTLLESPTWFQSSYDIDSVLREDRQAIVLRYLRQTSNDWEESWYRILSRSMGFHINSMPFEWMAMRTPLKIIRQYSNHLLRLEALLFGQSGLLETSTYQGVYHSMLQDEYKILRLKHDLSPIEASAWHFSRMRPHNSPFVRIAQLAGIMMGFQGMVSTILNEEEGQFREHFNAGTSPFWKTHYNFAQSSPEREKRIGDEAIRLLVKDAVLPFRKVFREMHGIRDIDYHLQEGELAYL